MSDCEQIAQVAHDKWVNEQITLFFEQIAHFLFHSQKMSDSLKKFEEIMFFCTFLQYFWKYLKKAKVSLIPSERSEWIAQVAQDKWATLSYSLRLLRRNE